MVEILHYLNRFQKVTLDKWERQAMSDFEGRDFTYAEVAAEIVKMNLAFESAGILKGDKIAICGKNSAHWGMAFLSTAVYDAVAVPILYDFTPEAIIDLCNHSDSSLLFTDIRTFTKLDMDKAQQLKAVINIDDFSCVWAREDKCREALNSGQALLDKIYPGGLKKTDIHFGKDFLDSIEVINYTSGTTGSPKGIMLTGRNLSTNIQFALETIRVTYDDNSISMLPLAHMYGMTFEYLYTLCGGSHIYFVSRTPSPSMLMAVFSHVKPYILITVPLVMEKIIKGKVIPTLEKPAVKVITRIPLVNKLFYRMVGRKVLKALGGRVREIPIGGAPLNR